MTSNKEKMEDINKEEFREGESKEDLGEDKEVFRSS